MSYEHKSNVKSYGYRGRLGLPLKIITSLIIVIGVLYFFFPRFLPSIFITIVSPLWQRQTPPAVSPETNDPNLILLQRENAELKALLGRTASTSNPFILSYILKKPPYSAYDIFIIDAGSDDGVKEGDKVYVLGDILIGQISEVYSSSAKVRLYSSYGEKYAVLIGQNAIQAEASGRGGGGFEIILPRDVPVKKGDIVTVPDLDGAVIGIVREIIVDSSQAFSTILFSHPINIYEQRWVFIEKI